MHKLSVIKSRQRSSGTNSPSRSHNHKKTFDNNLVIYCDRDKISLEHVIDSYFVPTFIVDQNHNVSYWNRACEALTGIRREDIINTDRQWTAFYAEKRPVLADLILDGYSEDDINKLYNDKYHPSKTFDDVYEVLEFFPNLDENGKWLCFCATPLKNENNIIIGVVETLRDITKRMRAENKLMNANAKLEADRQLLAEKNIAIRELLGQIEEEKRQIVSNVHTNINRLIVPMLTKLYNINGSAGQEYIKLIKRNLAEITSPFVGKLESRFTGLTPREFEICEMVKNRMSSKEIAFALNTAETTIRKHRRNIRQKLCITNKKENLCSYLQSF